jgi:hypothetical protein
MEAACSSEASASAHKSTWCHNPEDHTLNNDRLENLKRLSKLEPKAQKSNVAEYTENVNCECC